VSGHQAPRLVLDAAGFDLRPDPLQVSTPVEFVSALRRYWIWAGKIPYRELARRSNGEPATSTICVMLRKQTLPPQGRMLAFVSACGAPEEDCRRFTTAWRRLSLDPHPDGPGTQQIPAPRNAVEPLPDRQTP
jgi:hypothetical protein